MSMLSTYHRLNVCVSDSDLTVIREARSKIAANKRWRLDVKELRKDFYRRILKCHHSAQGLVREFRL